MKILHQRHEKTSRVASAGYIIKTSLVICVNQRNLREIDFIFPQIPQIYADFIDEQIITAK